jgi:deoxyadenosine/deoxycytidine kinase
VGMLVSVVGNTGAGKTTFVNQFCSLNNYPAFLEGNEERPFQDLFAQDLERYALTNQVDFLISRARQEIEIRKGNTCGIQDGGLDLDYNVYSKLFFQKGYLSNAEFKLCQQVYHLLREFLPPPDLVVHLHAPVQVITQRFQERGHRLRIAQVEDMQVMENLLSAWMDTLPPEKILIIESAEQSQDFASGILALTRRLQS